MALASRPARSGAPDPREPVSVARARRRQTASAGLRQDDRTPLWRCRWQASDRPWGTEPVASAATSPGTTRSSAPPASCRQPPSAPASSRGCSRRGGTDQADRHRDHRGEPVRPGRHLAVLLRLAGSPRSRATTAPAAGAMRSAAAQAAVSAGVALAGCSVHQLLPPRRGEPVRRAFVRNAGRRAVRVGAAGRRRLDGGVPGRRRDGRSRALGGADPRGGRPARRGGVRGAADPPVPYRRPGGGRAARTAGGPAHPGRRAARR